MVKNLFNLVEVESILKKLKGSVPFTSRPSIRSAIARGDFPTPWVKRAGDPRYSTKLFNRGNIISYIRKYIDSSILSDENLEKILEV